MFIEITKDTAISGEPVFTDEKIEVSDSIGRLLINMNKAVQIEESEMARTDKDQKSQSKPTDSPPEESKKGNKK
ncbi:hypothetical protein [Rubellicoccus peritrichatus]|uniref:Uncharacterized protein n=1 Tax=Rubellicoccus peritrichatus TaxID=3080537 RepID=A0AAQ3L6W9_9BACT|nr:hypothetical protein [Puniceicoccus sp. CR14]WOO40381.1 hypothetical protein RZN69_17315 [Puniceicoccus sp. CR14]WOO40430.1 hypothetical protein RZN69_17560 [Puniceicoccus sp. CR14]WOO40479.1 hypothetical protein RZN69_17805 [Puniceicoccus sp. CR14]WOO40528.1 hypothetical protein RZN69_18050 [Puniceicoccus sp. CR14]